MVSIFIMPYTVCDMQYNIYTAIYTSLKVVFQTARILKEHMIDNDTG